MGLLISRFRTKKSTIEVLEDIDKDISRLQKNRKQNQERQKKIVTSLLIYSIAAYVLSAIIFFVYYFPETWKLRFLYSLPLLIFPLLIWGLKKLLHWYFVKRIASNDGELQRLREQKKQILEDVMETETYKKAKEILEKFDPVRFRKLENLPENAASPVSGTPGTALHQRSVGIKPVAAPPGMTLQQRQMTSRTPMSTPRMPQPRPTPVKTSTPYPATPNLPPRYPASQPPSTGLRQQQPQGRANTEQQLQAQQRQQQLVMMGNTPMGPRGYAMPPGPPMPRTILPQKRGTMDRFMDYLVGDGPENRYALICQQCYSHNGMALKEEFEYLAFRCCYCYNLNPAKKQRPMAPRLEFFAPRGNNLNTDSQDSAASDDDSDDDEHGVLGEAKGNDTSTRPSEPRSGSGQKQAGPVNDNGGERLIQSAGEAGAGNSSSNAVTAPRLDKQPGSPARPSIRQQQRQIGSSQSTTTPQGLRKSQVAGVGDTRPGRSRHADAPATDLQRQEKESHKELFKPVETNAELSQGQTDATSVVDNDGGTDFVFIQSPQAGGGEDTDFPFIDEDGLVSSKPPNYHDKRAKEDLSFVSATTENQTDLLRSLASESENESSTFTSVADQGDGVDSSHRVERRDDVSGESLPDIMQERGSILSGEIQDRVQSLLSPSATSADDRDGGSVQCNEEISFANVNSQPQDYGKAESPNQPSE